mgnify:FL=1
MMQLFAYLYAYGKPTSSRNTDVKNKAAKLCKLMITKKFVEYAHFLVDLFKEFAALSLKLQAKTLSLPTAISSINTCISTINSMKKQPVAGGVSKHFKPGARR